MFLITYNYWEDYYSNACAFSVVLSINLDGWMSIKLDGKVYYDYLNTGLKLLIMFLHIRYKNCVRSSHSYV